MFSSSRRYWSSCGFGLRRQLDPGELASRGAQHVAAGAARHRQHHADVVDHEQRQVDAHPRERVAPRRGADQRHRGVDLDVRQRHRRDLAREEAATAFGGNRHDRQASTSPDGAPDPMRRTRTI